MISTSLTLIAKLPENFKLQKLGLINSILLVINKLLKFAHSFDIKNTGSLASYNENLYHQIIQSSFQPKQAKQQQQRKSSPNKENKSKEDQQNKKTQEIEPFLEISKSPISNEQVFLETKKIMYSNFELIPKDIFQKFSKEMIYLLLSDIVSERNNSFIPEDHHKMLFEDQFYKDSDYTRIITNYTHFANQPISVVWNIVNMDQDDILEIATHKMASLFASEENEMKQQIMQIYRHSFFRCFRTPDQRKKQIINILVSILFNLKEELKTLHKKKAKYPPQIQDFYQEILSKLVIVDNNKIRIIANQFIENLYRTMGKILFQGVIQFLKTKIQIEQDNPIKRKSKNKARAKTRTQGSLESQEENLNHFHKSYISTLPIMLPYASQDKKESQTANILEYIKEAFSGNDDTFICWGLNSLFVFLQNIDFIPDEVFFVTKLMEIINVVLMHERKQFSSIELLIIGKLMEYLVTIYGPLIASEQKLFIWTKAMCGYLISVGNQHSQILALSALQIMILHSNNSDCTNDFFTYLFTSFFNVSFPNSQESQISQTQLKPKHKNSSIANWKSAIINEKVIHLCEVLIRKNKHSFHAFLGKKTHPLFFVEVLFEIYDFYSGFDFSKENRSQIYKLIEQIVKDTDVFINGKVSLLPFLNKIIISKISDENLSLQSTFFSESKSKSKDQSNIEKSDSESEDIENIEQISKNPIRAKEEPQKKQNQPAFNNQNSLELCKSRSPRWQTKRIALKIIVWIIQQIEETPNNRVQISQNILNEFMEIALQTSQSTISQHIMKHGIHALNSCFKLLSSLNHEKIDRIHIHQIYGSQIISLLKNLSSFGLISIAESDSFQEAFQDKKEDENKISFYPQTIILSSILARNYIQFYEKTSRLIFQKFKILDQYKSVYNQDQDQDQDQEEIQEFNQEQLSQMDKISRILSDKFSDIYKYKSNQNSIESFGIISLITLLSAISRLRNISVPFQSQQKSLNRIFTKNFDSILNPIQTEIFGIINKYYVQISSGNSDQKTLLKPIQIEHILDEIWDDLVSLGLQNINKDQMNKEFDLFFGLCVMKIGREMEIILQNTENQNQNQNQNHNLPINTLISNITITSITSSLKILREMIRNGYFDPSLTEDYEKNQKFLHLVWIINILPFISSKLNNDKKISKLLIQLIFDLTHLLRHIQILTEEQHQKQEEYVQKLLWILYQNSVSLFNHKNLLKSLNNVIEMLDEKLKLKFIQEIIDILLSESIKNTEYSSPEMIQISVGLLMNNSQFSQKMKLKILLKLIDQISSYKNLEKMKNAIYLFGEFLSVISFQELEENLLIEIAEKIQRFLDQFMNNENQSEQNLLLYLQCILLISSFFQKAILTENDNDNDNNNNNNNEKIAKFISTIYFPLSGKITSLMWKGKEIKTKKQAEIIVKIKMEIMKISMILFNNFGLFGLDQESKNSLLSLIIHSILAHYISFESQQNQFLDIETSLEDILGQFLIHIARNSSEEFKIIIESINQKERSLLEEKIRKNLLEQKRKEELEQANHLRNRVHSMDKLPKELIAEYQKAFDVFDQNHDGTISFAELETVMKNLGRDVTEDDVNRMIGEVDNDFNGVIDFQEFCEMMWRQQNNITEERIKEAFAVYDVDGDGTITKEELKKVMTNLGQKPTDEQIDQMIKSADTDGDGTISYIEFKKTMIK
ncbi:calmodulin-like protein [Anaeramoeba ignava]|uniref:Calmodulin-like protein n=1 Tax=Anaeramoeba ignava TaxID=1746090 RepID=A0A9Q0LJQ0_ANAIG|nr:calmodulin-like protein [Anaeramoeba ignava]